MAAISMETKRGKKIIFDDHVWQQHVVVLSPSGGL